MVLRDRLPSISTKDFGAPHGPVIAAAVSCLLVALPWLWPLLYGPANDMWPNLVAWASAGFLVFLLPMALERVELAVVWGWLVAAMVSAAIGLLQFFDLENGFSPWMVMTRPGHVMANVHQVNLLATLLGAGLLSLWWLAQNRHLKPCLAIAFACVLVVGLAATASRTGLLHALLVAALLSYWGRKGEGIWRVVLAGLALYFVAVWLLPWLQQSFATASGRDLIGRFAQTSACSSRMAIWSNVLQMISMKPLTGWGWDGLAFAHYITPFDGIRFCGKLSNAHNLPLQLAVGAGLPLTLVVISVSTFALVKLKPWKSTNVSERLGWGVLLLMGSHSLVEYPLWFGVPQLMVALAILLIWRARHTNNATAAQVGARGVKQSARFGVAILMLAGVSYVAWDYFRITQLFTPVVERHPNYTTDTLNKVRNSWLFQHYVLYAVVNSTTVDKSNAGLVLEVALDVLKDFPDPEIIVKVISAARLTGDSALVALHIERFKSAWPKDFAAWEVEQSRAGE